MKNGITVISWLAALSQIGTVAVAQYQEEQKQVQESE